MGQIAQQPTKARDSERLMEKWRQLQKENPGIRIRRAADELGVSEAELLTTSCDSEDVIRLDGPVEKIIERAEDFGYTMALTRNEAVVHETKGYYGDISFKSHSGLVLGDNIDLRLFPSSWSYVFAVSGKFSRGDYPSIQFFNASGTAVHKIYLLDEDKYSEYEKVVEKFRHDQQPNDLELLSSSGDSEKGSVEDIDQEQFLQEWSELEDTHDFFGLLRDYGISRTQAYRVAKGRYTDPISTDRVSTLLQSASDQQIPIMVFVRSPGAIQIYSGAVNNIKHTNGWCNVLDEEFHLHINQDVLDQAWVIKKPVKVGHVTSVEFIDERGTPSITFFGVRKREKQENPDWRNLTEELKKMEG